ncbi:MAG: 5'-nucleotidase [Thermosphaera sp.]|nr:5'-nucleotidase [Thermosphaera sp.]
MPKEITSREEFIRITERAVECRVVKNEKESVAKVKAHTPRYLYTIKIPISELDEFLKQLKCQNIKYIE